MCDCRCNDTTKINLNEFAAEVARLDEGADESGIGQIKEIIGDTLRTLAKYSDEQVIEVINRYR